MLFKQVAVVHPEVLVIREVENSLHKLIEASAQEIF